MLKRYVIERNIPDVGKLTDAQICDAARTSNATLDKIAGVQWQQSFVTADKLFCIYLAESEAGIKKHAELSGFPAHTITLVSDVIDPTTETRCELSAVPA